MKQERIDILMNREIDGENTPDESRELEMVLATDAGQRRRFTELKEALGIFEAAGSLTPPVGLQDAILGNLEPEAAHRKRDWRHILRDFLQPILRPAVAGSFAVGLAAGLLIFAGFQGLQDAGSDQTGLVQGMAGHDRDTLSAAENTVRPLNDDRIRGELALGRSADRAVLTIDLEAEPGTFVRVTFGPDLVCTGFQNLAGQAAELRISGGAVGFEADMNGRYQVEWNRMGNDKSPIKIQIHHEGELVAEHNLATGSDR